MAVTGFGLSQLGRMVKLIRNDDPQHLYAIREEIAKRLTVDPSSGRKR